MNHLSKANKKIALLFPGQGSQKIGMGKDLLKYKSARIVFERMDSILNMKLSEMMLNGEMERLSLSEYSQPAILGCSYAMFKVYQEKTGFEFVKEDKNRMITIGHSLGEFSALTATNMFEFEDAIELVHKRGKSMQECVDNSKKESCMVAIMGDLKVEELQDLIYNSSVNKKVDDIADIANINSPQQIVLSGFKDSVDRLIHHMKEKKFKFKSIPLNVKLPFHTILLNPVCDRLKAIMDEMDEKWRLMNPSVPILMNLDCKLYGDTHLIKENLISQTTLPVNFAGCIGEAEALEITDYIEVGYGSTLSSLVSRNLKNKKEINISNIMDLE